VKLTLKDILESAQALIEAEGLEALSMRAIARRMNAEGSALYWHVRNRGELLTLIANGYYRRAFESVPAGLEWPDWLLAFGHAFHDELLSHRDAAHVCAEAGPENDEVGAAMNVLAQPLVALGLTRAQALSCQGSVIALTLGWATYEQSPPMRAYLSKALNLQASYRQGLEAMVLGMSQGSPK
jgi:TetR/AcrR family transcriptional regulator, tetracycline repressor protein